MPKNAREKDELQNVQRLEGDVNSQIILPRALGVLIKHDKSLLQARQLLIINGKNRGNTKDLS